MGCEDLNGNEITSYSTEGPRGQLVLGCNTGQIFGIRVPNTVSPKFKTEFSLGSFTAGPVLQVLFQPVTLYWFIANLLPGSMGKSKRSHFGLLWKWRTVCGSYSSDLFYFIFFLNLIIYDSRTFEKVSTKNFGVSTGACLHGAQTLATYFRHKLRLWNVEEERRMFTWKSFRGDIHE